MSTHETFELSRGGHGLAPLYVTVIVGKDPVKPMSDGLAAMVSAVVMTTDRVNTRCLRRRPTPRVADDLVERVLAPEDDSELDDPADDQHQHRQDEGKLGQALTAVRAFAMAITRRATAADLAGRQRLAARGPGAAPNRAPRSWRLLSLALCPPPGAPAGGRGQG